MGMLEEKLAAKIAKAKLSRQVVASLLDLSDTTLCRWLACTKPMPGFEGERVDRLLSDFLRIQEIIHPLELPTADVGRLRVLLAKFRDNGLDRLMDEEILMDLRERIAAIQSL